MSMVSDLLDFILNLLRNPDAAAAFNADPEGSLAKAGAAASARAPAVRRKRRA